jgi:hypothetical protein
MQMHCYVRNREKNAEGFLAWDYELYTQPTEDFVIPEDLLEHLGVPTETLYSLGHDVWYADQGMDPDSPESYPFIYLAKDGWEVYYVAVGEGTCWPNDRGQWNDITSVVW